MNSRSLIPFAMLLASTTLLGCSSDGTEQDSPGGGDELGGSGAIPGTGGGNPVATGGAAATGGNASTGGVVPSGGASTGGAAPAGGLAGTGGAFATGGARATGGASATGGAPVTGGATATGGVATTGGVMETGGATATGGATQTGGAPATGGAGNMDLDPFSFFVTSLEGLVRLSGSSEGFGGDLRYGEADGLAGADKICTELAEASMPGAGAKQWRAFLSVTAGPDGQPVNAIDRIGSGPWYDRLGRVLAMTIADLQNTRPAGADPAIVNDLPNEFGVPNHDPDGTGDVDNHHVLTGSNEMGELASNSYGNTCNDWTSAVGETGSPQAGFSWPRGGGGGNNGSNWITGFSVHGCEPGVRIVEDGGGDREDLSVGAGGGYGAIYCFALSP